MRTLSRLALAWVLGLGMLFIAWQDAGAAAQRTILVFGDSLGAAYGVPPKQGWVALLTQRLQTQGYGYEVVNASVSGETTEGGLERLPRALKLHSPAIVILELGGNDGLRGLPVNVMRDNLSEMVRLARNAGAHVLLVGVRALPNYGPRYIRDFDSAYPELADQYHLPLVPFLLDKVVLDPALMQEDGIHPNARGEPEVLETVWPYLKPLLKKN